MQTVFELHLGGTDLVANFNSADPNNLTRGESTTFTFWIESSDLVVSGTVVIRGGTTETYDSITIDSGATLIIEDGATVYTNSLTDNGTLTVDGTLNINTHQVGGAAFGTLQDVADYAGKYVLHRGTNGDVRYTERIPSTAGANSLLVGIEPNSELQGAGVTGVWGVVDSASDERDLALNTERYALNVTVLAELGEYADHATALSTLEQSL